MIMSISFNMFYNSISNCHSSAWPPNKALRLISLH